MSTQTTIHGGRFPRITIEVEQISASDARSLASLPERYVVRSVLGRGAFGTVYLADDRDQKRPVVIKLQNEGAGSDSAAAIQRFRAEVAAIKKLDHPRIVKILSEGITADYRPYFVTEWGQRTKPGSRTQEFRSADDQLRR